MGRSVKQSNAKQLASFWLTASEISRFDGSIRQGQFSSLIPQMMATKLKFNIRHYYETQQKK
jgi:hypothetical protein